MGPLEDSRDPWDHPADIIWDDLWTILVVLLTLSVEVVLLWISVIPRMIMAITMEAITMEI